MVEAFGGGFILAGTSDSCKYGHGDLWVVKIDDTGKVVWTKCYGGSQGDFAKNIIKVQGETAVNDGYLVLGMTSSNDGDVTSLPVGYDYWVVKLDVSGNIQWQKTYGGSGSDEAWDAAQTTDGGAVIVGITASSDGDVSGYHGGLDWWVLKVDQVGTIMWKKTLGGSGTDFPRSVAATNDGGVVITGGTSSFDDDVTDSLGGQDAWLVKLDAAGNVQWDKSYGSWGLDAGLFIAQTRDSGYILGANTNHYPSAGLSHGLIKLNDTGAVLWTAEPVVWDLVETANNQFVTAGNNVYDGSIRRIDNAGTTIWNKTIGGSGNDYARRILPTSDGGYIIGGHTYSNDGDVSGNHGDMDYWVVKLAPDPLSTQNLTYNHSPINVYPNPATDEIRFSEKVNVRMVNLMGQAIADQQQVNTMNISSHPAGIYFLSLYDKQGQIIQMNKIMKE